MDWLGVKFCVIIWVLCISQLQAIPSENEDLKCVQGQVIPPPDECNTCICFEEEIHCTRLDCPPKNDTGAEPKCISGERIQKPDECNACICFEGEVHCSNKPCNRTSRIGPVCDDSQPVYRPDECNECYCFEGRLECSDLVCIRGSKCVPGQEIPQPDSCNVCKCHDGYILCTSHHCSTAEPENSTTEVQPLPQCEEGDYIPPPPPPDDCNTCLCVNSRVLCTMETCPLDNPEINGRFKEEHNRNYLQSFDKPISVEPFINMFSKNGDKTPTKLIHTHAYNGFHQEIKVHTKHLPKDKAKLLNALANSLNNPTLADISDHIRDTSLNSPYNNPIKSEENSVSLTPLPERNVVSKNSLDSPEIHLTHSSKLIGSQSNETFLVIPKSTDSQNSKSVIPIQYKGYWDTLPTPNPQTHKNIHQIIPYSSEEETFLEYYSESPISYISSFDEYKIIRNPSKFGRPGQQNSRPSNPTRNIEDVPDQYTESVTPLNPQPTYINDEINSYAPFQQDEVITNPHELPPLHPDQLAGPVNVYKFNDTSSHPIYRPDKEQFNIDLNKKGSPHHYQLGPDINQFNPPQNKEPYQKPRLLISNKKSSVANPFQLEIKQNQTTPPQSGSKSYQDSFKLTPYPKTNKYYLTVPNTEFEPDQEYRLSITDNGGTTQIPPYDKIIELIPTEFQSDELFPSISEFVLDNQDTSDTVLHISQQKPIHSQFEVKPGLTHYGPNKQSSPKISHTYDETQPRILMFEPNSLYSISQHTTSKIELKPKLGNFKPAPMSSNLQEYNSPQTALALEHDKPVTIPHKDDSRYNTTPSHYNKHPKITYGPQYNPPRSEFIVDQDNMHFIENKPDHKHLPQYNSPNQFDFYPDQEQNESDSTMAKVYQYLNPQSHTEFDPKRWKNQTSKPKLSLSKYHLPGLEGQLQYDKYNTPLNKHPHIESDSQTKTNQNPATDHSYNPIVHQFKPKYPPYEIPQSHRNPGDLNDQEFQYKPYTDENPTNTKNSQHRPTIHQFKPYDQLNLSGLVEDPVMSKINSHKSRPSQSQLSQPRPNSNYFYDHGSINQFLHKLHFTGDFAPSEVKPLQSQFRLPPDQPKSKLADDHANGFQYTSHPDEDPTKTKVNQFKPRQTQHIFPYNPGMFDDRGSPDGFQYIPHSGEDPSNVKVNNFKPPQPPYIFPQNHQNPGNLDDRGFPDGFRYISHSGEDPSNVKVNKYKLPQLPQIFPQYHQKPGTFDDRGSADGFQYTAHSEEDPSNAKINKFKLPQPPYVFPQNHQNPGNLDDRGSPDGFQYISHSGEDPSNAKVNQFKPPQSPHTFPQNHQTPETFDDRGSAEGYTAHSGEDPSNAKVNKFKPPQPLYIFPQNHQNPGNLDDRGSPDGFQYISHSGEDPSNAKVNQFKPPQSPHTFPQNHQNPGTFDDRGSADGFQYIPYSGEDPSNAKLNQFKPPQSPHTFPQNPGTFDDRGSAEGYTAHSGEDPSNAKVNNFKPPQPLYIFPQNHQNPGNLDDRGSPDGFQYISHSGEDPSNAKVNQFKPPQSPHTFPQNHQNPGTFDDRGSVDGFQYIPYSGEDPSNAKLNQFKPPQSPHTFPQNPGTFDDRGSAEGYTAHSGEDPSNAKVNNFKPPQPLYIFPQNHQNPGNLDDRGSPDGFQYISHSGEDPLNANMNQFKPPQSPYTFPQNHQNPGTFDDLGSADGFQYIPYSGEDPSNAKLNQFKPPQSPHTFPQNPGTFDNRGSAEGYTAHSGEDPSNAKVNNFKPPQPLYIFPQNHQNPGNLDDRGSPHGFHYISHSGEDPSNAKVNQFKPPQSPHTFPQNHQNPGTFDDRGSADRFQYIPYSGEDPSNVKLNQFKPPQSPHTFPQNHKKPGTFDDRGSTDEFQYISHSGEDPTHAKLNQFKPSQPQHTFPQHPQIPGTFDDRGSADGFQYKSHSDEDPTNKNGYPFKSDSAKINKSSEEKSTLFKIKPYEFAPWNLLNHQNQPKVKVQKEKSSPFKTKQYDYDPWNLFKPDRDRYKPLLIDSLLNRVYNIPWILPKPKDTTKRPQYKLDKDQYKPSSVDNPLNGVHEVPWSDNTNFDLHTVSPKTPFKPDKSQNKPSVFTDSSWPRQNQTLANNNVKLQPKQDNIPSSVMDFFDSDRDYYNQFPYHIKSNKNKNSSLSSGDSKEPYTSDRFSPLLMAIKNYIELTSNDDPEEDNDFAVGATDHIKFLPFLIPNIFKNMTYVQSPGQDESSEVDKPLDFSDYSPINDKETLKMVKGKQKKKKPSKPNGTNNNNQPGKLSQQDIDDEIAKIFSIPRQPKLETTTAINDNSKNIQQIQTTTQLPVTESTNHYQNPQNEKVPDKDRNVPPIQFPIIHIILHQPNMADNGRPEVLENGLVNQDTDNINAEDQGSSFPQKNLKPRPNHRPKDKKEECGDGTEWTNNCHACSCHDGLATCIEIPDCKLRPFGEPMICKPYSSFKMGNCYVCECNGDGVAECDASNCKEDDTENDDLGLPVYHEFFDDQKTLDLLQYFTFYKKLPKDCPSHQVYPTCEAGTHWVSSCHQCECDEHGKHECTPIEDCELDLDSYGKPSRCKPNTIFYPKTTGMPCVECVCNDEGNPYCPTIDFKKH